MMCHWQLLSELCLRQENILKLLNLLNLLNHPILPGVSREGWGKHSSPPSATVASAKVGKYYLLTSSPSTS